MCKIISPRTKPNARHPGVQEFEGIVTAAYELLKRTRDFIRENQVQDETETLVELDRLTRSETFPYNHAPDLLHDLVGMEYMLRMATSNMFMVLQDGDFPRVKDAERNA